MRTLLAKEGYDALKAELLWVFDLTDEQRADRNLDLPGLGDKLPSVLTGEVMALVPKDTSQVTWSARSSCTNFLLWSGHTWLPTMTKKISAN